jgi:HEAT repeat protein
VEAVPDLIQMMETDDEEWMRRDAVFALGEIGPAAAAAVPALGPTLSPDLAHLPLLNPSPVPLRAVPSPCASQKVHNLLIGK